MGDQHKLISNAIKVYASMTIIHTGIHNMLGQFYISIFCCEN